MPKDPSIWCICYVNVDRLHTLSYDLRKYEKYKTVKAFIPKVRVLRKKFKGKNHYEEVPLLLNYGFFKVPKYFLPNPHFLDEMKKDIEAIFGWLKNPSTPNKKDYLLHYQPGLIYNPSKVAIARDHEIKAMEKSQLNKSIYTKDDIRTLYKGKVITLHGYPFDNLDAEIVSIDEPRKEVNVKLLLGESISKVKVSFDNIFYTVYNENYLKQEMREESLDAMKAKSKNVDNLFNGTE